MSEILITGGAGSIGSNLTRTLLEQGHAVTVLDDLSSGHQELLAGEAKFVKGSVTGEDDVREAFAREPEFVFHLAALFANQNSVEHPIADLEANGLGTLRLLQMCSERDVVKLLFVSSSCVYGPKEVMREDDPQRTLETPYAITKLLGEHYCKFWAGEHGLDVVTVRPFNSYGPHEYPGRYRNVIPNFFQIARRGEPLPITGTGEETRDFTFVQDIVDGMIAALKGSTDAGDVFNLGSGVETTIRDLAEKINKLTSNNAGIELRPRRSWDHVLRRRADVSKARKVLGFSAKVGIDEGLERTLRWLEQIDA